MLAGLDGGSYVVVAREGARAPAVAAVKVEATGEAAVELTLAEGGFVTGRLVDAGGKPVAGRVRLSSLDGVLLHVLLQDLLQAQAGSDGRFVLGPAPSGELVLQASAAGLAPRDVETTSGSRARGTDLGDIVLESGPVIRGVVQDRQGAGIVGATVRAMVRSSTLPIEAESGETGAFVLAGLAAGTIEVVTRAPGYASARQTVTVGAEDVVIALDGGGTVVGALVDGRGQPVIGATVSAEGEGEEPDMPPMTLASDGDGRFTLYDVRPGRYVVNARAAGYAPGNVSGVRVSSGATTDVGTIRLRSGGIVQGTVTDSANDPIAGASVRVETDSYSPGLQTQTDGAGAFQIVGLPAGRVDVVAQHPSFAPARLTGVTIEPEGRPAEATVVMTRGGRVEGVVRRRNGQPFSAGRVMVQSRRERRGFDPRSAQPIREDGSFVLERVPPGPSWLSILSLDAARSGAFGSGFQMVLQREAGDRGRRDGGDRRSNARGARDGTRDPRRRADGWGLHHVRVDPGRLHRSSPDRREPAELVSRPSTARRRHARRRQLRAAGARAGTLSRLAPDAGRPHASALVSGSAPFIEIPDVPSHTVDFTLGSARLGGIVVEQDGGKPIARAFVSFAGKASRGNGMSDTEGRFAIETEPGEGKLRSLAEGYVPDERTLSVGEAGVDDVRVELARGLEISGRVTDPAGRPAGDLEILAQSESDSASTYGRVLPNGSFRVRGLVAGTHALSVGSERSGFGYQAGIVAGATDVRLTLHPASPLRVRVVDVSGRPVAKATGIGHETRPNTSSRLRPDDWNHRSGWHRRARRSGGPRHARRTSRWPERAHFGRVPWRRPSDSRDRALGILREAPARPLTPVGLRGRQAVL